MKKNYLKGLALLAGLMMATGVMADNAGVKTKALYSYGAMLEGGFSATPTAVVRSYYDVNNRLVRVMEADIMLADSEGTPEVEVPGQEIPKLYSIYEYDAEGRLTKVRTRKYGIYSAFDRAWADFVDSEVYEYNAEGKLVKKIDATYIVDYTWDGANMVEEVAHYVKDDAWSYTIKYTSFAEGKENLPLTALYSDKWSLTNSRVYEYAYDEAGNKVAFADYKVVNAEYDADSLVVVKGDKGVMVSRTTWTYTDGQLTEELKGYWSASADSVAHDSKIAYTIVGDTTIISTYRYWNKKWSLFGGTKKSVSGVVDNATSATNLSVSQVEGELNTLSITATAPAGAASDGWKVYRNGMLVGEAALADGQLSFVDKEVPNGTWDYFVQHSDENTSEVVEATLNTVLPTVGAIKVVKNAANSDGYYEIILSWTAPESDIPVLGYNVYADIEDYETNPAPENGMVLISADNRLDTLTWSPVETDLLREVYVEAVYGIGKARSEAKKVLLRKTDQKGLVKAVITLGDAMGEAGENVPTKSDTYYYDSNNRLVAKVLYGKMLGDDKNDPDHILRAGDWIPMSYTAYDYNDKNQLVGIREREYGVYSGYNKAWNEFTKSGSLSYDEQGRLKEDTLSNRVYHYTYDENNNIIQETYANSTNVIIYHKYFNNFVEGRVNCPQYAFANSPYGLTTNDRIYEMTYDEDGNKISCYSYKYDASTVVKDDNGNIINAEKGTPDLEEKWTYEDGMLVKYEKNVWKTKNNAYEPKSRTEYTLTNMGVKSVSYSYSIGMWAKSGNQQLVWEVPFNGNGPKDLTVTPSETGVNTMLLKAAKPEKALATTVWNVFRNGVKIGVAESDRKNITYVDSLAPNGNWTYFIQAADSHGAEGVNISNVAEVNVYTELPPVKDIRIVSNHFNEVKDYELKLEWSAPETDLTIRGYNMFLDVLSITKNPSPINGNVILTDTTYTYTASNDTKPEKTFIVETVYNIGKVKSEALAVTLIGEEDGIEHITLDNKLWMVGNTLLFDGEYRSLEIYSANGSCVGTYEGTSHVDLSALNAGIYVVRVKMAEGAYTGKVIKK